jgi:hypothetical protein
MRYTFFTSVMYYNVYEFYNKVKCYQLISRLPISKENNLKTLSAKVCKNVGMLLYSYILQTYFFFLKTLQKRTEF